MDEFLRPAIFLLRKLRYPYKLALVSVVLMIPLCMLCFLVVSEINAEISKERLKLLGVRTIYPVAQLARAVQEHRAAIMVADLTASRERIRSTRTEATEAVASLDTIDRDFGAALGTSIAWKNIKAQWQQVSNGKEGGARRNFRRHDELLKSLNDFLARVGDASGLLWDSQHDSYYLIVAEIYDLPKVLEDLGQVSALEAAAADRKRLSSAERIELAQLVGKIQVSESTMETNIKRAIEASPNIDGGISVALDDARRAMTEFFSAMEENLLPKQAFAAEQGGLPQTGATPFNKSYRLGHAALFSLDRMLSQRISHLELKKDLVFASVTATLLFAGYLFLGFTVMLVRQLRILLEGAKRVSVHSDLGTKVNIDTVDEMATIAGSFNDMTASMKNLLLDVRKNENKLRESEGKYRAVVEQAEDAILLTDLDGRLLEANKAAERLLGYRRDELMKMKAPDLARQQSAAAQALAGMDGNSSAQQEFRLLRKDGAEVQVEVSATIVEYFDRKERLAIFRDVTQRKQMEEQLRLVAKVIENAAEAVMITDRDARIIATNNAFTDMTDYLPIEVLGKTPAVLKSDYHPPEFYSELWNLLGRQGRWQGEIWNRKKNGEIFPAWLSVSVVTDREGTIKNYVGLFSDISTIKDSQKQVEYLANYDALTGVPNRNFFSVRLRQTIAHAERKREKFALMFIDLDNFKPVNDTLGHEVGDMLLKAVAARLKECIRAEDTVARLGGDEFALILEAGEADALVMTARRIIEALSTTFDLGGHEVRIGTSIGIAIYPTDASDGEVLLKNADGAMYQAKQSGKNAFRFYASDTPIREPSTPADPYLSIDLPD